MTSALTNPGDRVLDDEIMPRILANRAYVLSVLVFPVDDGPRFHVGRVLRAVAFVHHLRSRPSTILVAILADGVRHDSSLFHLGCVFSASP